MERVTTHRGSIPVVIVVPHGYDDTNTIFIAEEIVAEIDAYSIINQGWKRADVHDYYKSYANCNNINHIHESVVKEEFLDPIIRYTENIWNTLPSPPNVFVIHGVGNSIRKKVNGDALDIIVGYGEGKLPSYTCPVEYKHTFMSLMDKAGLRVYQGQAGGNYSGRRSSNLCQLFRNEKYYDEEIYTLQLEIIKELREDEQTARETGKVLGNLIQDLLLLRDYDKSYDSQNKFPYI